MHKFRGINGTFILKNDCVVILREKGIDRTFHECVETEISYTDIEDVEIVLGGITNGYICIVDSKRIIPSNIFKAMKNDNTIVFRMFKNELAEKFANELRSRIERR